MDQGGRGGLGYDLLDDRMITMLALRLQHQDVAGGEHRMVAPHDEQSVLPGSGFRVQPLDPPHHRPTLHVLVFRARGEGRVADPGDFGVGDQFAGVDVHKGVRVVDRRPHPSGIWPIAAVTDGLEPVVSDTSAP